MPKPNHRAEQIRLALRDYRDPATVAAMLGAPLGWVQRLATEMADEAKEAADGPHPMAKKLKSAYGGYWAEFEAAQTEITQATRQRLQAAHRGTLVPDDRRDEFDDLVLATAARISAESRREGRGAA